MTNDTTLKKYKNTKLDYQGSYEKDFLNKYYDKIEIENGLEIKYKYKSKNKKYYSDFYLPKYDLIIEVKSSYWYEKFKEQNLIKEQYSKIHHNFIFIMNKNYDELDKLLKIS